MKYRVFLLAAASAASLASGSAFAQTTETGSDVEELVVTGTRTEGRSRLETLAPVDVITADALQQRGSTELATALAASVPSITFPRPSNTDGTDAIRPATLRGQGPDQTLVLVNGTRRHATALVNTNGSVGRGSAAVDLNAIPSAAIDRIEVLRDGASAQYGSDAIAGVINLRLREAATGGGLSVTYGSNVTSFDGFYGRDDNITDGATTTVSGWQGLTVLGDGFLTLSGEYRNRENTNRSDIDKRVTPNRITSRFGDADVEELSFYANAGKPLNDTWDLYGWYGYQHRDASSAATFRLPTDTQQNVPSVYPNGYLPLLTTDTEDNSAGLGIRGEIAGFRTDINVVYGKNDIDFGVQNTINPSFGAASPTSFQAGGLTYDQIVFGADFSREFEVGMAGPLNVAFGVEARQETYKINQGQYESYARGPITGVAFGSRGFTGFTPSNEVDVDRNNVGVYIDLEGKVTEQLTLSGAIRYEDYSDFGDTTTGKFAARYDFTPEFAIRGAVSTGFRAPALQQQYYTSTSILYIDNVPFETGTYPATSNVAAALGAKPLKAETSDNYALGFVFRRGAFELTVDGYKIDVKDRIVLSETLQGNPAAAPGTNGRVIYDLLAPYGSNAARFFINGVDTDTVGVDVVARYRIVDDQAGIFDLTAAGNINDVEVKRTPVTTTLPTPTSLFARQARLRFEEGTPKQKLTLQGDWKKEAWGATVRTTFYGDVLSPGTLADGSADNNTGNRGLVDLEARYTFPVGLTASVGADNVFDVYPRQIIPSQNTTSASPFSSFSPFGFSGRFVYGRLAYNW
ncbi:MAG: TonB-dependent receptor [Pseudomonadota bacterium]